MSVPVQKIYRTVKLAPGEQFTLPPGANLISATDTTSVDSSCDTGILENLICYAFVFGNASTDGSSQQLFEAGHFSVVGVSLNGNYTQFNTPFISDPSSSPVGQFNLAGLVSAINAATGGVLISPRIGEHNEGPNGIIEFISFKIPASMSKSIELKMVASTAQRFNSDEGIHIWIKPRLYTDLSMYSGLPPC